MGKEVVRKALIPRLEEGLHFPIRLQETFDAKGVVMKTSYEQFGGTYSRVGDYSLPNMDIMLTKNAGNECSAKQEVRQEDCQASDAADKETIGSWIGKYGLMRKTYLKEYRPVLYAELVRSAKLHKHLSEVNEVCTRQVEEMTAQIAEREGVSEALKAADPMAWVARMNSIQNCAEEIVLCEYVFA